MKRTGERIEQRVYCHCGDWYWKYLVVGVGVSAVEKKCPQCDETKLLVFRHHEMLAAVPLTGRNAGSFREALGGVADLSPVEVDALVAAHRQLMDAA